MRDLFLRDPALTFLNHGSYGATPKDVLDEQHRWQREMERNPVAFLGRRSADLLMQARATLAATLGAQVRDLVFMPNATTGVNTVADNTQCLPLLTAATNRSRIAGNSTSGGPTSSVAISSVSIRSLSRYGSSAARAPRMTPTKSSVIGYREICAPENMARLAPLVLPRSASRVCGLAAPVSAPTVRSTPVDGRFKAPFGRM